MKSTRWVATAFSLIAIGALLDGCASRSQGSVPGAGNPPTPSSPGADADSSTADGASSTSAPQAAVVKDGGTAEGTEDAPLQLVPANVAESINLFARDLHRELGKKPGNLFYSPLSISIALTMTWAGARRTTADEMAKVLHLGPVAAEAHREYAKLTAELSSDPKGGAPEVRIANRLFVEKRLELVPEFAALTREHYRAPVEKQDFLRSPEPSRLAINAWVEQQTKHRIEELLPKGSIDGRTLVVLTNAIYFKGLWATPFAKDQTRDEPFYANGTASRAVPTMQGLLPARYAEVPGAQVLELPYARGKGPGLSLVVLLPRERTGLPALERRYAREAIAPFVTELRDARVRVWLPRFTATVPFALKDPLRKLGMPTAFTDHADFLGMVGEGAKINEVHHKAFVRTDEEGTEAAAATAVVMVPIAEQPTPNFRADHPFLFVIRDRFSGVVLFAGRVAAPAG